MTMLAWWGCGAQTSSLWDEDTGAGWKSMVLDVTMCMREILKTAPALPSQKVDENDNISEPASSAPATKRSRKPSAKADAKRKALADDNGASKPAKKA
jgi:hypothetical protein